VSKNSIFDWGEMCQRHRSERVAQAVLKGKAIRAENYECQWPAKIYRMAYLYQKGERQ